MCHTNGNERLGRERNDRGRTHGIFGADSGKERQPFSSNFPTPETKDRGVEIGSGPNE